MDCWKCRPNLGSKLNGEHNLLAELEVGNPTPIFFSVAFGREVLVFQAHGSDQGKADRQVTQAGWSHAVVCSQVPFVVPTPTQNSPLWMGLCCQHHLVVFSCMIQRSLCPMCKKLGPKELDRVSPEVCWNEAANGIIVLMWYTLG